MTLRANLFFLRHQLREEVNYRLINGLQTIRMRGYRGYLSIDFIRFALIQHR